MHIMIDLETMGTRPTAPIVSIGVWGNGASFDNVILSESYYRAAILRPWPFWKDRCYRTIKTIYPDVELVRSGTHHNALDDARTQAEHLIAINATAAGTIL